ncbi:MAG: diguanylate cyclase [Lachnospiraceae bacterium]
MKKERQNHKHVWKYIIFILLLFGCILIGEKFISQIDIRINQTDNELDEMVQYLIKEDDSYAYDTEKFSEWETTEKKKLLENEVRKNGVKVEFIRGCIAANSKEYEEAARCFEHACSGFSRNTDKKLKARIYFGLSKMDLAMQEYDEAKKVYDKVAELYRDDSDKTYQIQLNLWYFYDLVEIPNGVNQGVQLMEDTYEMAKKVDYSRMDEVLFQLSQAYGYVGNSVKSMTYKLEAMSMAMKKTDNELSMKIAADIGVDFLERKDYKKGSQYLQLALSYDLKDQEKEAQQKTYIATCLVRANVQKKDYKEAEKYLEQAEAYIEKQPDGSRKDDDYTYYLFTKAELYVMTNRVNEAFDILDETKTRYERSSDFYYVEFDMGLLNLYGEAYYAIGQYQKALEYYKKEEQMTKVRGLSEDEQYVHNLYLTYKAIGDSKRAYWYMDKLLAMKTKAYNDQENQHASYLLEQFESQQKEQKIQMLEARNQNLQLMLSASVTVVIIILFSIGLIVAKNKEIKQLNAKFKSLSEIDSLTQLANRRTLDDFLDHQWILLCQTKEPLSIAMLDVDYFKKYNDHYGHQKGDRVLEVVGRILKEEKRKTDFIARYGGEEFLVILPETSEQEAVERMQNVQKKLAQEHMEHAYSKVNDYVTLSIGVTTVKKGAAPKYEKAIKEADDTLYIAKKTRNTVARHSQNETVD